MAKKSRNAGTPSQRLANSLRLRRKYAHLATPDTVNWSDSRKRSAEANLALSFNPNALMDPDRASIRKAFIKFGLKAENPHNWRKLLGVLASAHFPVSNIERKYLEISSKFREFLAHEELKNAIADTAKHFSISDRKVWIALARTKKLFGADPD